ncbi:hypothetical protein GDI1835 [Gluconacetobacter diazotrophicus PA1 5]|uniref:Uncharacterized protein n=1 Tax=Gluconacetobacter diazotrophicus (strain ATCC 49037 / DSM 5601 / CCUG 37298 / CIP 103539 / LMG 7603 / PAl5) TaxID=272568 RepID=A9HIJ9_GLUDA|nr:hypothetical protein GDI1835 [Gluconacetobacter diazotrophicus PA1 5]
MIDHGTFPRVFSLSCVAGSFIPAGRHRPIPIRHLFSFPVDPSQQKSVTPWPVPSFPIPDATTTGM